MSAASRLAFRHSFPLAVPPSHPLRPRLRRALACLEGLHPWPLAGAAGGLPRLGVRTEPLPGQDGLFDPGRPGLGLRIADDTEFPCFTLAHEIGHALDWYGLGAGTGFCSTGAVSVGGGPWPIWWAAILASDGYHHLRARQHDDFPPIQEYARYLLQPQELFARAYAQWAALASGCDSFAQELTRLLQRDPCPQWQAQEFVTIGAATTALLEPLQPPTPSPAPGGPP